MTINLNSIAEKKAQKAEELTAFSGLNLLHIKRQAASLLGLIGQNGIFDQYTKHDISHIDEMLANLDWIIPDTTKSVMSEGDWLMIVLAVYFHDMGMLVTKDEFEARQSSGFPKFCDEVLFVGQSGADYKAKIDRLEPEDKERFLYQEFVRHKHAERVRAWIMGQNKVQHGIAETVVAEISKLLEPLGPQFRRDLGLVCESHHLNDLADTKKYKLSQPYGNSDAATVNLQYCAVILRTADLLHITSDRTPSIEFRTINPSDPLSQQEWAKQMAVKRVRPKLGLNEEGLPDEKALRDTVEVHAFFVKEDGFFGLTSYLSYASDQLKKSHEWIGATLKHKLAKHEFPWRKIDDANIETEGFIRDAFEFTIDQAKILDLLTGHTLYNDTNVVLRELVQNAIDAIRLQHHPDSPLLKGKVRISWDSETRILCVLDNGTGMTQDVVNNFLLKVGSSRYQDPDFKKQYPGFSSISRFGIGVLSTFMIADSVEIITCHPEEEQARRLILRSVHGKYLIRLLDKENDEVQELSPHGTMFKLRVRPSIDMPDVTKTAKQWIVVPDCEVIATVDGKENIRIGFTSPAEALRNFLKSYNVDFYEADEDETSTARHRIRIVEKQQHGVDLAYALEWNSYFKEWKFLTLDSFIGSREDSQSYGKESESPLLGTCVEGIRIVTETPGFQGYPIVALANVKGAAAPKTNVARSGLEATPERDIMLQQIYSIYANHIIDELNELTTNRSFSSTWATGETMYLLSPLLGRPEEHSAAISPSLLLQELQAIPYIMVEENGQRYAKSPNQISQEKEFWTIDCGLLRSAELLIREVASEASLSGLIQALNVASFEFPNAPVVCGTNYRNQILQEIFAKREVDTINVNPQQRRVDLRWVEKSSSPRWLELPIETIDLYSSLVGRRRRLWSIPLIPQGDINVTVPSGEIAVRACGSLYLIPGSEIVTFVRSHVEKLYSKRTSETELVVIILLSAIDEFFKRRRASIDDSFVMNFIRHYEREASHLLSGRRIEDAFDVSQFLNIVMSTNWKLFDTSAWRRENSDD